MTAEATRDAETEQIAEAETQIDVHAMFLHLAAGTTAETAVDELATAGMTPTVELLRGTVETAMPVPAAGLTVATPEIAAAVETLATALVEGLLPSAMAG